MISKPQNNWYWRMWGAVTRWCKANGLPEPDRHELHARALGADKSHTAFDEDDFDDVMSAFYAIAEPDNLEIQVRFATMRRTRAIYACRRNALKLGSGASATAANNYIAAIARDRFGKSDWESLAIEQLRDLRNTLAARAISHRKKAAPAVPAGEGDPDWNV